MKLNNQQIEALVNNIMTDHNKIINDQYSKEESAWLTKFKKSKDYKDLKRLNDKYKLMYDLNFSIITYALPSEIKLIRNKKVTYNTIKNIILLSTIDSASLDELLIKVKAQLK